MSSQLQPAWYTFKPGESPTDLELCDSLMLMVDHLRGIASPLHSATNDSASELNEDTVRCAASHLDGLARKAGALVARWNDEKQLTLRQAAGSGPPESQPAGQRTVGPC